MNNVLIKGKEVVFDKLKKEMVKSEVSLKYLEGERVIAFAQKELPENDIT